MKNILKLLAGLAAGLFIGFVIGGLIVVLFTDTTWIQYMEKYYSLDMTEGVAAFFVGVLSLVVSLAVIIPIHELGHLICGLLSGYRFISFRIFNYTLIRDKGRFRIKKFGVAGTGGQCLLVPPELPVDKVPTGWYNFGGLLANLVLLFIGASLFTLELSPFVAEALGVFILTDLIIILLNAVPVPGNDGYNIRRIRKSHLSKLGIVNQLLANALIQQGVRPKDMPEHLFCRPESVDYKNPLEVSILLMYASRLLDEMKYEDALKEMEAIYAHKDEIMSLYVKEISCELVFLYLCLGKTDRAEQILDDDLRKYVESYRKMMSSKERLLFAIALCLDKDEAMANEIYNGLLARKNDYLLKGEVESDLALMYDMKGCVLSARNDAILH